MPAAAPGYDPCQPRGGDRGLRARLAGADVRLDVHYDDVVRETRRFGGNGVDLSVDAIGSVDAARHAVESLRRGGRHVQIGLLPPAVVGERATVPM